MPSTAPHPPSTLLLPAFSSGTSLFWHHLAVGFFERYDADEDGLLSPREFTTLVRDLRNVHGDIDALAGRRSNPGCLGKVGA